MLHLTPLMFITNVIHAYYVRAAALHHAWVVVLATSLLYHGRAAHGLEKHSNVHIYRAIDMTSVAGLVTIGAVNWWQLALFYKTATLALFASSVSLYVFGQTQPLNTHAALHVSASLGHHLLLAGLPQFA